MSSMVIFLKNSFLDGFVVSYGEPFYPYATCTYCNYTIRMLVKGDHRSRMIEDIVLESVVLISVPFVVIASFRRMKKLVGDLSLIEAALRTSSQLVGDLSLIEAALRTSSQLVGDLSLIEGCT